MPISPIAITLESLSATIKANPEKARAKYAPATATLADGLKCRVTGPAGEAIETDMGKAMGGNASAPNPGWYFRASIAACCSTAIAMHAAQRGINLTALEVTVEGDGDARGLLGLDETVSAGHSALRTHVRIAADNATPEQLQDLVQWSAAHAPVGRTVQDAAPNALRVDIL
jgi:uncharacterized OsmC-like protein